MINSFENYIKLGKVRKKTPDSEEAKSLLKKSKNRLKFLKSGNLSGERAPFILEDSYEALREATQAIMSIKGFKPYSHEATIAFIRDFYKGFFNEAEISDFDRFRQLRNDSVYRAIKVNTEDAKKCLAFSRKILKKIEGIYKDEIQRS